jgi:alkylhydroperoxidase family enzyme
MKTARVSTLGALVLQCVLSAAGPRMAPVPVERQTAEQASLAATFASSTIPNAVATYLNHPALAGHVLPYEHYVWTASTLPPRHRAIVGLRTIWLTRSEYLWAHRVGAGREAGLSDAELRRIAEGPDARGWDSFEAVLLRAADELHVDSFVSDATWKALSARYDTNQLIDLVDSAGAITMHAGAINSLGVALEPGVTDRFPPGLHHFASAGRTNIRLIGKEARIPPLPPDQWSPELRQRFDAASGRRAANVFVTFVRNPTADRLRGPVNQHILDGTTLPVRLRELLLMRIGVLCRSEYEWAAHSRLGRQAGKMTDADVARIVAGPDNGEPGDPLETTLLRTTDELFRDDRVSDATWDAAAKELDTRQLLDVLIAVGGYRATSMAINSAGVQLDANMAGFRFPPELR